MKIRLILTGLILTWLLLQFPISWPRAVESTTAAVLAAEASSSTGIRDKLEALKAEIASKAAEIKKEVNRKIENKAWVGTIKDKTDKQLTLAGSNGDRIVIVNEYTVYATKTRGTGGSLKDLDKGDVIAALGDVDDKGNLTARKVVRQAPVKPLALVTSWGEIQAVSGSTIVTKNKDGQVQKVIVSDKTGFMLSNEEASLGDARAGKFLVAVGEAVSESTLNARFVYYIPSAGFMRPDKKLASPSASAIPSVKSKK